MSYILSSTLKNFHFIPFISPSPVCFYNCGTVGSIRPTFPLISIFGQKLYTRCLFSWSSPGRRLLYYFPVFRTQFFITSSPNIYLISTIKEGEVWRVWQDYEKVYFHWWRWKWRPICWYWGLGIVYHLTIDLLAGWM